MNCACDKDELYWCRRCWRWETREQRGGPGVRAPLERRVRRLLAWPFSLVDDFWSAARWFVRGHDCPPLPRWRAWLARVLWHVSGFASCVWLDVLGDDVGPACPPPPGYYQPNDYPYAYPDKHRECERAAKGR